MDQIQQLSKVFEYDSLFHEGKHQSLQFEQNYRELKEEKRRPFGWRLQPLLTQLGLYDGW